MPGGGEENTRQSGLSSNLPHQRDAVETPSGRTRGQRGGEVPPPLAHEWIAEDPLGGRSGPADQARTHYRRSGPGPPQKEATTGRGVGKRQPPFLACLSRPGRRCLRATITGPGPRDHHRRRPGPPGPAAAWTPCCPDLLPGPETGLGMPARPGPAAAVPGPSRQRPPAPSHRRRPATSGSSSPASPPPRRPRRDDSTATDSTSSSGTPATVRPRNPTLARQEITIFFPVPRLVRCPKRGCGTSYGGSSWTARVQSLRRHLETEHGQRIRSRVYVCTICGETIRARPSYHRCLETAQAPERPPPGQHQCDRCSQSFPSARGLYNHRTWHQTQDAAARSAGSTRSAPTGPAPQVPPLGDRAETPLLDALPQAPPSPGPPSVPSPTGQASVSPLGSSTRDATSPAHDTGTPQSQPSPSQSPSISPEPATDDGADPDETDDPPGTPPVEDPVLDMRPDHTDLLGDQARLLRQLIREPPSQDSWDRCEAAWAQARRLDRARSGGPDLCVAMLDLTNAYGSVSHKALLDALSGGDAGDLFTALITDRLSLEDLYTGNSTCLIATDGVSEPVPIRAGLGQACPLSGLLFNLVVDAIVFDVQGEDTSHPGICGRLDTSSNLWRCCRSG
ncbi:hypothetical protein HPB52_023357 [Rhipicephalus sanguineus]|uniref:C2H2-type domain-containing protein n=1 Tax=Rhipicephalus sanguineus TaxID=34632 RepID=A0A9D4T4I5_RHISA|nr:hypothetical protein HPB52_023357 [Rhipicephalus sanguineus]